jgi:hypothetical protein
VQTTHLVDQLNQAIANYTFQADYLSQSDIVQRREKDLDSRAKELDDRVRFVEQQEERLRHDQQIATNWHDDLLQDGIMRKPAQSDRLSRVYIQLTDILKAEANLTGPHRAFLLHRLIAPSLDQLTTALANNNDELATIIPAPSAVSYYTLYVRHLQSKLYDDEWEAYRLTRVPFETKFTSNNPRPRSDISEDDDGQSSCSSEWGNEW